MNIQPQLLLFVQRSQNIISDLIANPTEEFIRILSVDLLNGKRFSPAIKEQYSQITKRAFQQLINDRINERLKVAMTPEKALVAEPEVPETFSEEDETQIITTQEEIDGYNIIKAVLREVISPKRTTMRDAQSYCAILLDDNNRRPICRLRFNNPSKLVLGLFNGKDEDKIPITNLDDIFNFADRLKATAISYIHQ